MSLEDAFRPSEAAYKAAIMEDTWGHLAPLAQTKYTGYVLFTLSCHGDITVIDYEFNDPGHNELSGSPWFYQDLMDFVGREIDDVERGTVLRFEGSYMKFKNGNCRFSGSILQSSGSSISRRMKEDFDSNKRRRRS